MLHKMRSKEAMSTPRPSYMSDKQMSVYLEDLRSNRIPRPHGSRPAPTPSIRRTRYTDEHATQPSPDHPASHTHSRSSSALSHTMRSLRSGSQTAIAEALRREGSVGSATRAQEKQEAHEVRMALNMLDLKDDGQVHTEAQAEAVELIWKHQNPGAPFRVKTHTGGPVKQPELDPSQIGVAISGASTSQNVARVPATEVQGIKIAKRGATSTSTTVETTDQQEQERRTSIKISGHYSITSLAKGRRTSGSGRNFSGRKRSGQFPNAREKIYEDPSEQIVVSAITPPIILPPPEIVEEPKPVQQTRPNPFQRVRSTRHSLPTVTQRSSYTSPTTSRAPDRIEIHRNPPSQTRNPDYVSNPVAEPGRAANAEPTKHRDSLEIRGDDIRAATSMKMKDRSERLPSPAFVSHTPGRPIVSFLPDWRPRVEVDPTPKPLFHQNEALQAPFKPPAAPRPQPAHLAQSLTSVTSTGAAIPIVVVNDYSAPTGPAVHRDPSSVPRINACEIPSFQIPSITIDEAPRNPPKRQPPPPRPQSPPLIAINEPPQTVPAPSIPSIQISEPSDSRASRAPRVQRRLPQPANTLFRAAKQPAPNHASTTPHQTPAVRRTTALCAHCALPIAGRIVSAAGTRFHPECFTCFHCGTGLECVAFFPEPEERRQARLERRSNDDDNNDDDDDDDDESLRFYCHLDFHESFSPRCKSCTTPIEGEVVLACGAHWHVGHFFCALCGDPFDPSTPFVEKDGFAWCVGCHATRFSPKCKRCRRPVADTVVQALGADWHAECFCCTECGGAFSQGRYFLRAGGRDPVCLACEERRLKG